MLRDFRTEGLTVQRNILEGIVAEVRGLWPKANIEIEFKEQYRNMFDDLAKQPTVLDNLWEAAIRSGVEPYWKPIRGRYRRFTSYRNGLANT